MLSNFGRTVVSSILWLCRDSLSSLNDSKTRLDAFSWLPRDIPDKEEMFSIIGILF